MKRIKVSERGSTSAIFLNECCDKFILIRYDGCIETRNVACDWLVVQKDSLTVAVELKGSDVDHAAEQVFAGLSFARGESELPQKFAALIVCTRYPRIDTKLQRIKQRAFKIFRAPIHVTSRAENIKMEWLVKY